MLLLLCSMCFFLVLCHGVCLCIILNSPPAIERLSSGLFQEVIITNTIPLLEKNYFPQLTVLSVANLLGETIWQVHDDCSVSGTIPPAFIVFEKLFEPKCFILLRYIFFNLILEI